MASKRVNQSSVWEHMDKVGNGKVQCWLCSKQLIYAQCGSTTSLRLHLWSLHPTIIDVKPEPAQKPLSAFGVGPQRPCNDSRQEKITSLLVRCLVANMLPLSLVDNAEFRELMAFLEPNYAVPCRQTVAVRLDSMKAELSTVVSSEMESAAAVHITTDIWSSITNEPYISMMPSFITDDWRLVSRTLANAAMEDVMHCNGGQPMPSSIQSLPGLPGSTCPCRPRQPSLSGNFLQPGV